MISSLYSDNAEKTVNIIKGWGMVMRLKEIPWFNRPWNKIKRNGITSLDDAELLSVIFIRGNVDENSIELSNKLLSKYNLNKFAECSFTELEQILGDESKAYQVMSLSELFLRYSKMQKYGYKSKITSPKDVFRIFSDEFKYKKKEYLYLLLLDPKKNIIKKHMVSKGILDASLIHPREVFKPAISESAHSIILVHNHPSGDCSPSDDDINITIRLVESGKLLGIKIEDHLIIGKGCYYSMKENKNII